MRPVAAEPRSGWSSPRSHGRLTRRFSFVLLLTVLVGGMFVSTPPQHASADALSDALAKQKALQRQIAAQKARVASLTRNQGALKAKLASTQATLASTNADLQDVKAQIVQMTVDVANAQSSVDELDATVAALDHQLADVQAQESAKAAELAQRKATLAGRIQLAYDTDRTTLLETFLSGETFTDVLAEVSYHLDLGAQDKALAEQIVDDQKVLAVLHETTNEMKDQAASMRATAAAQKQDLDQQYKALRAARDRLAQLEAQLKRALAQQQATYAQMAKDKASLANAIAAAEKAEEQLSAKIQQLVREQYRHGGIPSRYSGSLRWPMPGTVTQWFGCTGFSWEPPLGSCAHFHRGIDTANSMYTPVRAAGPGRVIIAGPNPYDAYPKAWIVVIAHSSNLLTWYAHLDNKAHPIPVKAGQWVVAGQVIGYEGMTGHTTGPHLHWAVQLNGTFVNPRLFL